MGLLCTDLGCKGSQRVGSLSVISQNRINLAGPTRCIGLLLGLRHLKTGSTIFKFPMQFLAGAGKILERIPTRRGRPND
jgi:hypothetical protein|tara:strand:- start:937 stop:1173 length:237 start_codon:yes stop_codon:yes gene_type:complete